MEHKGEIMESFCEYSAPTKGKVIYKSMDKIRSAEDAYVVGNLAFDGTYATQRHCMVIETTDEQFVNFFKKYYSPTSKIKNRGKRSSKKVKAVNDSFRLYVPRPQGKQLGKYGIMALKKDRGIYSVPSKFMSAWFLGALDAEGWWTVRHRKDCRTPRLNFGLLSSAVNLVNLMQCELLKVGISSRVNTDTRYGVPMAKLRVENVQEALKLGEWIYSDLPKCFSKKKKKVFTDYVRDYT